MSSKSMFIFVVFILVLGSVLLMGEAFDCNGRYGCFYAKAVVSSERENRKLLAGLKHKKETVKVKGGLQASATGSNGGSFQGWELRRVPSGPDPLHHNGGNPTKPRTP